MRASLSPSGHILGAACVRVADEALSVVFSGDLGRYHDSIMRPPEPVRDADYLVVESTYGDRRHDRTDADHKLAEVIDRTVKRGGTVIIPAFAVGRTQSLLLSIARLKAAKRIPAGLPIYLNSPMAQDVTAIYHNHRAEHRLSVAECKAACRVAHIVNSVEESKKLNESKEAKVLIAGSGMATGGRVVHHLAAFAADARNTIVLAGFQAGGTRGAAILAGADQIKIHGNYIPVRAEVVALNNLSAHADADELLQWMSGFKKPPLRTFITHGEPAAADALRLAIQDKLRWSVRIPQHLESVELRQGKGEEHV
jgi:metallo-beta-lactamase family protein